MKQMSVEEIERGIRAGAFIDAAEFFRDSDPTVAKILEEFAEREANGLDMVQDEDDASA